ncbi:hypothetical protein BH09ACT3_BH09ACT3_13490 [soil metagenome]
MRRRIFRNTAIGSIVVITLGLGSTTLLQAPAAVAAPGVPAAPTVVYLEDFENAPDGGVPQLLNDYVSSSPQYLGGTYTGDPLWVSAARCNGFILSAGNIWSTGACANSSSNFASLRTLAPALGTIGGTATSTNSIVAAYTAVSNAASGLVQFATVSQVALASPSRYLVFSVDAAAQNCHASHPQMQFAVRYADSTEVPLGTVIDPCTDPRGTYNSGGIIGGRYASSDSFLTTEPSIGVVMRNLNGGITGNDGAFDNIQILDGTPDLDKSFSTPHPITGVSTLTLTLTNTSDLASKLGWGATDTLAPGLEVASPSNAATTCTNGAVTAVPGSSTIDVSGDLDGDLAHSTSCTFTVDVVPATLTPSGSPAQVFQNCGSNLSNLVGVELPSACAAGTFPPVATLAVSKTTTASTATREGDVVQYAVTLTNTGGSAYTIANPATFTDDLSALLDDAVYNGDATSDGGGTLGYAAPVLSWSGPLAVGASVTVQYTMTVSLAGNAVLANTACVPAGQASAAPCATVTTTVVKAPSIDLVKSVSPSGVSSFVLGQVATYSFVVTNTGNLVLANPSVSELLFNGAGSPISISCPATPTLAPGVQLTCTASYTIVQADIDNRTLLDPIVNTAQATATASNAAIVVSPIRSAALPTDPLPALGLTKTAGPGGFTSAGQIVDYSFAITNLGNVTLTGASITELGFTGTGTHPTVSCPAGAASLLPGASVTCTGSYTLTQADVDAGTMTNQAEATATAPGGAIVTSNQAVAGVTIASAAAITLLKTADPVSFTHAGEVVDYEFVVTNVGNVTLTGIAITETAFSGTGTPTTPSCTPTTLAPGASVTCTASYALTQADVDSGIVTNAATARGLPPTGPSVVSAVSDALVTITPGTQVALAKSVDRTMVAGAGERVTYLFRVTNTGQSTVTGVAITDSVFSGTGTLPAPTCPATTLAPGAWTVCSTSYLVTAADADNRVVNNSAVVSATSSSGGSVLSTLSLAELTINPLANTGPALTSLLQLGLGALIFSVIGLTLVVRRKRTAPRH